MSVIRRYDGKTWSIEWLCQHASASTVCKQFFAPEVLSLQIKVLGAAENCACAHADEEAQAQRPSHAEPVVVSKLRLKTDLDWRADAKSATGYGHAVLRPHLVLVTRGGPRIAAFISMGEHLTERHPDASRRNMTYPACLCISVLAACSFPTQMLSLESRYLGTSGFSSLRDGRIWQTVMEQWKHGMTVDPCL